MSGEYKNTGETLLYHLATSRESEDAQILFRAYTDWLEKSTGNFDPLNDTRLEFVDGRVLNRPISLLNRIELVHEEFDDVIVPDREFPILSAVNVFRFINDFNRTPSIWLITFIFKAKDLEYGNENFILLRDRMVFDYTVGVDGVMLGEVVENVQKFRTNLYFTFEEERVEGDRTLYKIFINAGMRPDNRYQWAAGIPSGEGIYFNDDFTVNPLPLQLQALKVRVNNRLERYPPNDWRALCNIYLEESNNPGDHTDLEYEPDSVECTRFLPLIYDYLYQNYRVAP